jgi:AsmA-like C-terminal region
MLQSELGKQSVEISGRLNGDAAQHLGLLAPGELTGEIPMSARLEMEGRGLSAGHVEVDMTSARLALSGTDWRKPADEPALLRADFTSPNEDQIDLTSVRLEGASMDAQITGRIGGGKLVNLSTARAQIKGLFDGQIHFERTSQGSALTLKGDYLDARRVLHELQESTPSPLSSDSRQGDEPWQLSLDLAEVRVSDRAPLSQVHLFTDWGKGLKRRLEASAKGANDGSITLSVAPKADQLLVTGQVKNLGQMVESLSGFTNLKGGTAQLSGQLVPDGADLMLTAQSVRVAQVPVLAQILTLGAFSGVANTLNGEGIQFAEISSRMALRDSTLEISEARATGDALGLTTHGLIDLSKGQVDLAGAMAPAYALNSAVGKIPVVGAIMISRQGEGVFGLTYSAKGAIKAPKLFVNPLSLATPGMLRRVFDGVPLGKAVFKAPPPKPEPEP